MTGAGPSTPRRSRRRKVLTSAAASSSGTRPSRDVTTSPAASPSEPRPSKLPRLTFPPAGLSEPRPSGHHDVATSEATRPSEPQPFAQHDQTISGHPGVTQRKFQSKSKSHHNKITQTCLRCREGKVCICPYHLGRYLLV